MRNLKALVSVFLVACLLVGFTTGSFITAVGESIAAHAESQEGAKDKKPVSDEMESGGWRYRLCADGFAELLGYTDTSVTSLTFPTALEGVWVVRIAEGAFEDNSAVTSITVSAQINEIPSSAFSNNTHLTVHAYNGTAAMSFAAVRGFDFDNKSKYDLFDDVLDLSDMKPSQWNLSGHTISIDSPYSRVLRSGAKVYLPPIAEYINGLPVEITSSNPDEGLAYFTEMSFGDAVESFRAENVQMTPDIEHIQILAEGVDFDASSARGTASGSVSLPLNFTVNLKIDDATSVSGTVGYSTNLSVSVDYGFFKINEYTYQNKTTSSWNIKVKTKGKFVEKKAPTKSLKFARVPMISATVISVWLDLSVEVSVEGEVSFKGEIATTEKCTWKNGKMTKSKSISNKKFDISVSIGLVAELKGAIVVRVGFVALKTYIEVAEVAVSYGWKIVAEWSTESPVCMDVDVYRYLKITMRIGLLKSEVAGNKVKLSVAFGGEVFNITNKTNELHFEFPTLKFVDSCTMSKYATVKLYVGKNDSGETYKSATVEKGEKLPRPSNPSRSGYTFGGWYKDIYYAQAWDFNNDTVTKNITLYAKWTNNATGEVELPDPDDFDDDDPASDPARLLTAEESLPYLKYDVGDSGVTITGYNGSPIAITIPDEIEGKTVIAIEKEAFINCYSLIQMELPDSITKMGACAFSGTKLSSVRTPANWTEVTQGYFMTGGSASPFGGCATLRSVVVPEGATVLPDRAFNGIASEDRATSSIVSISLPSTLTKIGSEAFGETNISSIDLPNGLKELGIEAFRDCAQLRNITLPDSITKMGACAFSGTKLSSIRTPANWTEVTQGYFMTGGSASPFGGCATLRSVVVPEGATVLPDRAFNGISSEDRATSSIVSISLPSTLTKIGSEAFGETGISEIIIPKSVATVDENAMSGCPLLCRIIFLGDVKTIGSTIADNTALSEVYIPAGGSNVKTYFENNYADVRVLYLPSSYHALSWKNTGDTFIPDQMIQQGMKLTQPEIPVYSDHTFAGWYSDESYANVWNFEQDTMPNTDLTLYARWNYTPKGFVYTILNGKATITKYDGDAVDLTIPNEIGGAIVTTLAAESIPDNISKLDIPAEVTSIDPSAFRYANGLVSISVDHANSVYNSDSGVLYKGNVLVCYPQSKADSSFAIPNSVTTIGERGFYGCGILHSLTIPSSVKALGLYGIYGCDNLESISFVSDVSDIATGNFLLCSDNLNVTGPIGASKLTAYADSAYVNYNMYNIIYIQDDAVIGVGTIRAGEKVGELPSLESDDQVFVGWSTTEDGSSLWTDSNATMPAHDVTLYAVFKYPFHYIQSGSGVKLTKYTGTGTRVRIPKAIDGKSVIAIDSGCFSNKSITLIGDKGSIVETFANAQGMSFEAITYTLTFETNGGTKVASRTLAATAAITLPTPIRVGYELKGWYTNEALTVKWVEGDKMPASDLTLYARWKRTGESATSMPFDFEMSEAGIIITGFTGTFGKVDIPASINGEEVVGIAEYAFADNPYIQVVTVPSSIKEIYEYAFAGSALYSITLAGVEYIDDSAFADCTNLAYVTLPDTLLEMGTYVFQNCSALLSIDIPDEVTELKGGIFAGCEWLTDINLPSKLETIQSGAFQDCRSLESLSFGANVSDIPADAFEGCIALNNYTMSSSNMYFKAVNGVLFNKNGTQLILYPKGKGDSSYTIPAGVTTIAANAMSDSRMKTLKLNSELTTIGVGALSGSSLLETIVFNSKLSTIGANAFDGCVNLTDVTLPESIKKVGLEAFDMTGLVRIYIPAQTELGKNAIPELDGLTIYGHRGSEAEIYANAHGIRFIDSSADVEVTGISIPATLSLQPGSSSTLTVTFTPSNTTETTVVWSSEDETIARVTETGKVEARSAGSVKITAQAANGSIAECTVTVIKQPVNATSISLSATKVLMAVGDMRSISATVLPVNSDDGAVTWSVNDTSVASWFNGSIVGLKEGQAVLTATTVGGLTATCSITVKPTPGAMGEPDFKLPQALTEIESEAFTGLAMKIIKCPEGLKKIGAKAFANCKKLTQIYIPATVTSIASDAFSGCSGTLVIYGKAGSKAETFANTKGYLFVSQND